MTAMPSSAADGDDDALDAGLWAAVRARPALLPSVELGSDVLEQLMAEGLTDGLPCVPPTRGRVWRMLRGAAWRDPGQVLGRLAPSYHDVTVLGVAVAAVMAGCHPRQFPVVLAAAAALLDERFNIHGVGATTMGATPCVIVNGPARLAAGLNGGLGALGSGQRGNPAVGRAVKLLLQHVGCAKLGGTESTTIGSPLKLAMCLAENEECLVSGTGSGAGAAEAGSAAGGGDEGGTGWEPLHTMRDHSLNRGDSAVTLLAVTGGPTQLVDMDTTDPQRLIELLAGIMVRSSVGVCVSLGGEGCGW